jgi:ribosomal protein S18 acetylase RimI-like enzyme
VFELSAVEAVGYVASALVVLSLAMTSVVRLRIISLAGSVAFVVYGVLIDSAPIIVTNVSIAVINLWFLRTELGFHRDLGVSPIRSDSPFLADFVHFHLDDIRRFQPDFEMPDDDDAFALLLTRDGLPAGAVVGRRRGDELDLVLDYVLRAYRDSRLGTWLYGRGAGVFRAAGVTRLVTRPGNDAHRAYLERIGFQPDGDRFVLDLT